MLRWCIAGFIAAVAVAWAAAMLHASDRAPVILISVAVGVTLGAVLHALAATLRVAGRTPLLVGTLILALITVLAQHAWLYHNFRRQWHEARANSPQAAMFRPESPWSPREYFERELTRQQTVLWLVDAALITTAATTSLLILRSKRQPPPTSDP